MVVIIHFVLIHRQHMRNACAHSVISRRLYGELSHKNTVLLLTMAEWNH